MNVIGISFGYHDSACCLLQDGLLVAAAQEERFSRIKNDKAFPAASFRYCLDHAALTIADIDCVAFYENPGVKLGRQLWMGMLPSSAPNRRALVQARALWTVPEEIQLLTGFDGAIEIVDHHLSHAASAFFYSGFKEAAVLTVDGVGEWQTTTYNSAQGAEITCLDSVDFPDSLGLFYSAVTGYLGFEVNEGEYKVMGLAPYGQPRYAGQIREMIKEGPLGSFQLNLRYYSFLEADLMFSDDLIELLGMPPRSPGSDITQFHMDVARSAQVVLEEILLAKVRYLHGIAPSDNLCMAGGVALNVVANSRCLNEGPFKHLFVQPAAGDAGGCLGAAAVAHVRRTGTRPCQQRLRQIYLGPCQRRRRDLEGTEFLWSELQGLPREHAQTARARRRPTGRGEGSSLGFRAHGVRSALAWGKIDSGRPPPPRDAGADQSGCEATRVVSPIRSSRVGGIRHGTFRPGSSLAIHVGDLPNHFANSIACGDTRGRLCPYPDRDPRGEQPVCCTARAFPPAHRVPDLAQHILQPARRADRLHDPRCDLDLRQVDDGCAGT